MRSRFLILVLFIKPVIGIRHLQLNILTGIILKVKLSNKFSCYHVKFFYVFGRSL